MSNTVHRITSEIGGVVQQSIVAPASPLTSDSSLVRSGSRAILWADRVLFGSLLLVLAMNPFEAGYPPLGRFLFATYTNLELALFIMGVTWLVKLLLDPSMRQRLLQLPLRWPILALVGACILSTIFAENKQLGVHFTYRLLMGVLVLSVTWEALRTLRRLVVALGVLVAAGFVSGSLGLLEYVSWFNIEPLLAAFKPMPTTVGGAVRLSGSFEYANGAAIYFEMLLPVVLGLAALFSSRQLVQSIPGLHIGERARRVIQVSLYVLCAIFMMALLLTFSRAALFGVAVALLVFGLAAVARRRSVDGGGLSRLVLRSLAVGAAVMALGAAYIFVTQPVFRLRLTTENDRSWYMVSYQAGTLPALSAGEVVTVPLTLRNNGPMLWRSSGALTVHVSYHWMSEDKSRYLVFEGVRTPLPSDVSPGQSATIDAMVQAPSRAGRYFLQWDMVQENVTWFSYKSGIEAGVTLSDVAPETAATISRHKDNPLPPLVDVQVARNLDTSTVQRTQLWKVALAMFLDHPIVGVGPDGFRELYGHYAGVQDWNRNIYTNNTYIEFFTNLGLLGGLAFLWLTVYALWLAGRNLLRVDIDARWVLALGVTGSVAAFFFHGLGDYFLFSTPLYTIFWLLLVVSTAWPRMVPAAVIADAPAYDKVVA